MSDQYLLNAWHVTPIFSGMTGHTDIFYCTKIFHFHFGVCISILKLEGEQWLSGRVLDSRPRGCGFEPHKRHCVVVLEQDTFILA